MCVCVCVIVFFVVLVCGTRDVVKLMITQSHPVSE